MATKQTTKTAIQFSMKMSAAKLKAWAKQEDIQFAPNLNSPDFMFAVLAHIRTNHPDFQTVYDLYEQLKGAESPEAADQPIDNKWRAADFSFDLNPTERHFWSVEVLGEDHPGNDAHPEVLLAYWQKVAEAVTTEHPKYKRVLDVCWSLKAQIESAAQAASHFHPEKHVQSFTYGIAQSVFRSLANTALIRMISTVTPAVAPTDLDDYAAIPKLELALYLLAKECIPSDASEYDKPMTLKSALLLLMQDKVPSDEVVEALHNVTGISPAMLQTIAVTDSKRRTERFKKFGASTIRHLESFIADNSETRHSTDYLANLSIAQQHNVMARIIRALNKTRQSALRRMLNTGSLDQLGVFPLCDAEAKTLYARMQDLEIEHFDEIEQSEYKLTADSIWSEYVEAMPLAK